MVMWLLLLIFLLLAVFNSPWWWIPTVLVGLQRALVWRRHHKSWWRIHDRTLSVYAWASGIQEGSAKQEGRSIDINEAIAIMLKQVHPSWDSRQIAEFIFRQSVGMRRADIESVMKHLLARRPSADDSEKKQLLHFVKEGFERPNASLQVRIVIAGLIEEQLGTDQRGEYLYQAFLGNV